MYHTENTAGAGQGLYPKVMQNQPKEIGICQRIEGLRGGLDELQARLAGFINRIGGGPPTPEGKDVPQPYGLPGNLSHAEQTLRECMTIMSKLNDTF